MSLSITSPMSDEERKLIEYRNSTNFKSVKRADSSVSQILDTSVYSVIYNYDEKSGKWEKQKQEGPLFVVQRDKSPEWSLYMLNRQGLKNPAIPLVPGEMKLTVIDQAMLQVARRGDKQRIGIWFSEGPEVVERFRTTVLGICGEPSKRPNQPNVTSSPAVPTATAATAAEDGLSRLFAGLMKSPPIQSPPVQPAVPTPPTQTTTITATTGPNTSQPILTAAPTPIPAGPIPVPTSSDPISTHGQLPISPPPPPQMASPPGQTADDLLMSILGMAPPPPPAQQPQQAQQQQPSPEHLAVGSNGPPIQNISPIPYPSAPQPQRYPIQQFPPQSQFQQYPVQPIPHPQFLQNRATPPPPGPHSQYSPVVQNQQPQPRYHKIGDATFAQTAATASSLPPPTISPNPHSATPSPAIPFHTPAPNTPNHIGMNQRPRNIIAESVVDGLERRERDEGLRVAGIGLGKEERKLEFTRRVADLILSDERFVDELWESYLDRMSRAAQGG
ncbi:uncharacterized protein L201_001711 [Kwoniella dendrophila CBS 6074]|uniref:mRNA-decapping enzyme C-terminal domain-containing protein n=1 Tax=Kwoniella dendrophila CBS 6074 TaxID=1295534 RepID=A0AAX4JPS9_9TREE